MTVRRFDLAQLSRPKKTAEGMLRGEAHVTRTGVFVYKDGSGKTRRELRHPDDVFHRDSLETLKLVPMTLHHPASGFVDSESAESLSVGSIGSVFPDGNKIRAEYNVTHKRAVDSIESGETPEISCGYNCNVRPETGVFEGQRYDWRQTDIAYNHVAAVKKGRAGEEIRFHLDSEDACCVEQPRDAQGTDEMKTIKIDGVEYDATTNAVALQAAIDRLQARSDSAEKSNKETKAEADKAQARADGLEEKLKKAEEKSSDKAINERVKVRAKLINDADEMIDSDETAQKLDSMTDLEIKKAVLLDQNPKIKLDGKSEDYIQARYDQAVEDFETEDDASEDKSKRQDDDLDDEDEDDKKKQRRNDSSIGGVRRAAANASSSRERRNDSESAREAMVKRNQDAWLDGEDD